jgi:hypothetical protein
LDEPFRPVIDFGRPGCNTPKEILKGDHAPLGIFA